MASLASRRRKGGRGPSWTDDDIHLMLDQVAIVLPQGGNGWTKVAALFNAEEATSVVRDADSIQRKFNTLTNTRKPTGHPERPSGVARAKRIQREMENKAAVVTLGKQDSDVPAPVADSGGKREFDPKMNLIQNWSKTQFATQMIQKWSKRGKLIQNWSKTQIWSKQQGSRMIQKWSKKWSKPGNFIQKWPKTKICSKHQGFTNDPKMIQKRSKPGNLIQKWPKTKMWSKHQGFTNDPKMIQKWSKTGNSIQKWS